MIDRAVQEGGLKSLQILLGGKVPDGMLRICMQQAMTRNREAALECARLLKDPDTLAKVLAEIGSPLEMLTANLYLGTQLGIVSDGNPT